MSAIAAPLAILALLAVVVALNWAHGRRSRDLGRAEARETQSSEVLDNVDTANAARRRLRGDGDHARRLRRRFTRPE